MKLLKAFAGVTLFTFASTSLPNRHSDSAINVVQQSLEQREPLILLAREAPDYVQAANLLINHAYEYHGRVKGSSIWRSRLQTKEVYWVQQSVLDLSVPELQDRAILESSLFQDSFVLQSTEEDEETESRIMLDSEGKTFITLFSSTEVSSLGPFWELVWLPKLAFEEEDTINSSYTSSVYPEPKPVPPHVVERVADHIRKLTFNPTISRLISDLPKDGFYTTARYLTGEDQSKATSEEATWESRHSMSVGGERSSNWVIRQFREAGLNCTHHHYLPHFSPMIECVLQGTGRNDTAGAVVLGAHIDSRGSFGFPFAPGGDDDGSGSSLIIEVAKYLASLNLVFERKVIIAAFSGEEQGLLGSNYFANHLKQRGEDVVLMIQVDMVAYRKPGEPMQLAFPPDTLGLQEGRFLMGNISSIYVPELVVGITPACCSDHQSFSSVGYPATWIFERNGAIADPEYHNSGDLTSRLGYDWEQLWSASKVALATVLEIGLFSFP